MPLIKHSLEGFIGVEACTCRGNFGSVGQVGTDRGHAGKSGPRHAISIVAVYVGHRVKDHRHDSSKL